MISVARYIRYLALYAVLVVSTWAAPITVGTLAGTTPSVGWRDGTGTAAQFYYPEGLKIASDGTIYIADQYNNRVRKITPAGVVTTFAGTNPSGGAMVNFLSPTDIAIDNSSGNIYVAEYGGSVISKITPAGVVSTFATLSPSPYVLAIDGQGNLYETFWSGHYINKIAPNGTVSVFAGSTTESGYVNGAGIAARFDTIFGLLVDKSGTLYVSEAATNGNRIRKVSPTGVVSDFVGAGPAGNGDGMMAGALFTAPAGMSMDGAGNIYVGSQTSGATPVPLRKITPAGVVSTPAILPFTDTVTGQYVTSLHVPRFTAVAPDGTLYWVATYDHTIYRIDGVAVPAEPHGIRTLAGSGAIGSADGLGTVATFNHPYDSAVDLSGNVYVADTENHVIRKIDSAGNVSLLAGSVGVSGSADGFGSAASFYFPEGVAVDAAGNVYVADTFNQKIRKITSSGYVMTVAGSGAVGAADGVGSAASFNYPISLKVDSAGTVYVADSYNHLIRKIAPGGSVSTLAGPYFTDTVTNAVASFVYPLGLTLDPAGNIYVSNWGNHMIYKVTATGSVGWFAGSGSVGSSNGTAASASFNHPRGLALDGGGNLYVADQYNNLMRKIAPGGIVTTIAGPSFVSSATGLTETLSQPSGLTIDMNGSLYLVGIGDNKVRKIAQ